MAGVWLRLRVQLYVVPKMSRLLYSVMLIFSLGIFRLKTVFAVKGTASMPRESSSNTISITTPEGNAEHTTSTNILLSISAKNLIEPNNLLRLNPVCIILSHPSGESEWKELTRTEVVENSRHPVFDTNILVEYRFEKLQPLKFEILNAVTIEAEKPKIEYFFMGSCECNLARIIRQREVELDLTMRTSSKYSEAIPIVKSTIIIKAKELTTRKINDNDQVTLQLSGMNLDIQGPANTFIDIHKVTNIETSDKKLVHRTMVEENTKEPRWRRFSTSVRNFFGGDKKTCLIFTCKNWDRQNGTTNLIGEFETTVEELEGESEKKFELIDPKKKGIPTYQNSGSIVVDHFELVVQKYSFLDYILGDMQIHCFVAIDLRAAAQYQKYRDAMKSNVPIQVYPEPLHYYEESIRSVLSILEDYNSQKKFSVIGFGARPSSQNEETSGKVLLDEDNNYKTYSGVKEVLEAYHTYLSNVVDGSPYFSPFINRVAKFAKHHNNGFHYSVLLILTDGQIEDLEETMKIIVDITNLPLSIIIVGIGDGTFEQMKLLDSVGESGGANGMKANRDIVQFVPISAPVFVPRPDDPFARERLSRKVFVELSKELVSYMRVVL